MSLARRKQVLALALIGFSLWPLVQMELVRRFGISPWKLAGWGMYAAPRISPGIAILVQEGSEEPAPMRIVPPAVRVACENFAPRRLWLRNLAPPDAIGELVLAANPAYQKATIQILELRLDTETGMVRTEATTYQYDRHASGERRKP